MTQTFELTGDFIELYKLLKLFSLSTSGGMAKAMIADGTVLVDGQIELRKRCKLRRGQVVECGGEKIEIV